jgi:hypothetical protein
MSVSIHGAAISNGRGKSAMSDQTFTLDEIETIKQMIREWGFEYGLKSDRTKLRALGQKLGMSDAEMPFHFDIEHG